MIETLVAEYIECARQCESVDYADKKSVRQYNKTSDRMRAIVDQVVQLGPNALERFTRVLDTEPASGWAAHHLVEKVELAPDVLKRCFAIVGELADKAKSESRGNDAMGEEMWLKEWSEKRPIA